LTDAVIILYWRTEFVIGYHKSCNAKVHVNYLSGKQAYGKTTVAKAVENFDKALKNLVEDMTETMYLANGIGLAATQVNVHKRLLVMDISENQDEPRVYINPELLEQSGEESCEEGCLSVPGVYAMVKRAENVTVRAQDIDGKFFEEQLESLHAVCIQHEMDHLIGRLFVDYLSPLRRKEHLVI